MPLAFYSERLRVSDIKPHHDGYWSFQDEGLIANGLDTPSM